MDSNFEERMLKKVSQPPKKEENIKTPFKHKPLDVNTKVNITGKPQSLEELMKAMGLPIKKKEVPK